ncbi:hypothetical protein JXA47_01470 [Candidatus Sumerlaeota bacterium]|nr:hypothetical protein [Candidatus Sumerlaeota bacterium]
MRHLTALLVLAALAAACRYPTIPPTASQASEEEIMVTGIGLIDARQEYPIRSDQIYPQARQRALGRALRDAQSQMVTAIADLPIRDGEVRMGDMMLQHESVRLLTEDFVDSLPMETPRWKWDEGVVEVDLRMRMGEFQGFLTQLPHGYLATTQPGVWESPVEMASDLPLPTSAEAVATMSVSPEETTDVPDSQPTVE